MRIPQSLSSYRFSEYTGGTDQQDSLGAIVFPERGKADQYSAELQFSGDFASWKLAPIIIPKTVKRVHSKSSPR